MRNEILKLLRDNNNKVDGIYIQQELESYVDKLLISSKIIAAHENGAFQGFISYYKNDPENRLGYLSMLLINKNNQSKGIGAFLLKMAIEDLKHATYKIFQLEVLKSNNRAITLYTKFGFEIVQEKDEVYLMQLRLK